MKECAYPPCNREVVGRSNRKFCSSNCKNNNSVTQHRRNRKLRAVALKGGKCEGCGYNACVSALHFHHPGGDKDFGIGASGHTRSWASIEAELKKCVLLCANCHAQEHCSKEGH